MTRDEHRKECVEAMAIASANSDCTFAVWDTLSDDSKEAYRREQAAAFDALHGIALVVPVEATAEMCGAGQSEEEEGNSIGRVWAAMSAAGDLTKPPERKP